MCWRHSNHGTTISKQRAISQCLFMTPGFSRLYNDPSSLLPQSPSLFIVTGNYTMERLHHILSMVGSWQEDALRMFWELHLANSLLWSLLFLSKNRTALANPVPELGPKQPRVIAENRNNHRVTQRWLLLLSSRKENRRCLSSSVKIILWRMLIWVFQQRAVQETGLRKAGHWAEVVWFSARAWARVRQTGYKSQPAFPPTTVCLCASYLNSLGLGFSSVKSLQDT